MHFNSITIDIIPDRTLTRFNLKLHLMFTTNISPYEIATDLSQVMLDKTENPLHLCQEL